MKIQYRLSLKITFMYAKNGFWLMMHHPKKRRDHRKKHAENMKDFQLKMTNKHSVSEHITRLTCITHTYIADIDICFSRILWYFVFKIPQKKIWYTQVNRCIFIPKTLNSNNSREKTKFKWQIECEKKKNVSRDEARESAHVYHEKIEYLQCIDGVYVYIINFQQNKCHVTISKTADFNPVYEW